MPWLSSWSGARISTTWRSPTRRSTRNFVNYYRPEGRALPETDRPASGFQAFYGALLQGFPDATVEINEQLAERDLVATRKTFRGTHLGELWDLPPTGNRVELEFIDIFRVCDGRLIEHWTSMDIGALRQQMRPPDGERVTVTLSDSRTVVPASSRACPTHGVSSQSSTAE
jgi:predicted ester cyclase